MPVFFKNNLYKNQLEKRSTYTKEQVQAFQDLCLSIFAKVIVFEKERNSNILTIKKQVRLGF
jgi:hypothetical protein